MQGSLDVALKQAAAWETRGEEVAIEKAQQQRDLLQAQGELAIARSRIRELEVRH